MNLIKVGAKLCRKVDLEGQSWECLFYIVWTEAQNMNPEHVCNYKKGQKLSSWDTIVSIGYALQNLGRSSRSSGNFLPTVLWILWIRTSSEFWLFSQSVFAYSMVGKYAISDADTKGLVCPKIKILSLITHPHVVPNP